MRLLRLAMRAGTCKLPIVSRVYRQQTPTFPVTAVLLLAFRVLGIPNFSVLQSRSACKPVLLSSLRVRPKPAEATALAGDVLRKLKTAPGATTAGASEGGSLIDALVLERASPRTRGLLQAYHEHHAVRSAC